MAIQKEDKLLKLDICFKLPADFKGDLNDAIQALLDYRKGKKEPDHTFKPLDDTIFNNWWVMVNETDLKLLGAASLSEYDGEDFKPLEI